MSNSYAERVLRYVVEYREELSERHRAEYRLAGFDPDNTWTLKYSFTTQEAAAERAQAEQDSHDDFCKHKGYQPWMTFRCRDIGAEKIVDCSAWF